MTRADLRDITGLDDPDLLAERRRVRDELEAHPTPALTAQYELLDAEFIRRAGIAWNRAKP
jgi:FXSXX-COOH protein